MNCVVYTRVSTKEQVENNKSLEMQREACKDYAAKQNLDVVRVFVEEGESAKTADRTELQAMLRYCSDKKNKVEHVIVWKLDRLARKTQDHLMLTSMFAKYGARLHSATEPLEATPSGRLMEHILASVAEFDNDVRSERSRKGMEARLAEGGWVHVAPIGYKNHKDIYKRPTLSPDDQALGVAKVLTEFSKGFYTQKDMAERARTKYKIRTKKGSLISNNGLYKMLRNPVYAGFVDGKSLTEPIKGLHEGLISKKVYLKNIAILEGRNPPKGPKNKDKSGEWSLRQFLKCAYCNKGLTGSASRGRSASYNYYHCTKCKGVKVTKGASRGRQKHLTLNQDKVDKAFLELLKDIKPPDEVLDLFRKITLRTWNSEFKDSIEAKAKKEDELNKLHYMKTESTKKYSIGKIQEDSYSQVIADIAAERYKLELELDELTDTFENKEEMVDNAVYFLQNADKLWSLATSTDRARFQNVIIQDGITVNESLKFGTANFGPIYKEIHLLTKQYEVTKKTQKASESLVVIPRGIEPRFPG